MYAPLDFEDFKEESLKKNLSEHMTHHLAFLQKLGFQLSTLTLDKWVKCLGKGEFKPTGAYAYKTFVNELRSGDFGLITIAKVHGEERRYETVPQLKEEEKIFFRLSFSEKNTPERDEEETRQRQAAAQVAKLLGRLPDHGRSDYLENKGVGAYGLKFSYTSNFGHTAIVPMVDIDGRVWSCQYLNGNGDKVFFSGSRTKGMFHYLTPLTNGQPFGIAESYATAATVLELTGVPMVCAFSCNYLESVARSLRQKYPASPIIVFADNDRHLPINEGISKAQKVCDSVAMCRLVAPHFKDHPPGKDASDWNDLIRLEGKQAALNQLNMGE